MISAVVIAKNEEKNIEKCITSLSWCDEIIVIDDESIDKTGDIAKRMGVKVFVHSMNNDFSSQRNFGLEKAKGEWVLFVDADEQVSEPLWYEIMQHTNNPLNTTSGYFLKRRDILWKRELRYGEMSNFKILRLAKKPMGRWEGKVHEVLKVKGKVETLNNILLHFPHESLGEFLQEVNFYTDLRARELYDKNARASWWSIILYPKAKFLVNFFFRKGFLDGLPGLVFALMMSFHSFLVRAKLWQLWQKETKNK